MRPLWAVLLVCAVVCLGGEVFDPYTALEVARDASAAEIKRAFRALVRARVRARARQSLKYHPDKQGGDRARFEAIGRAYEILGDEGKRMQFDSFGEQGFFTKAEAERAGKASSRGLFSSADPIVFLTPETLATLKRPALIEFYAPWCVARHWSM
jgi:curved DNA-binding protein CbpA